MTNVQFDMSGALHKTRVLHAIPKATEAQLSMWAADTVTALKMRVREMKKSGPGTGQLWRNIGFKADVSSAGYRILLGTGTFAGMRQDVKYASIQDRGGIIQAKGKLLTIPFKGVKGTAASQGPDTFIFKSKKGNLIIAKKTGKRGNIKPLFVLKQQVKIPATGWFTTTLNVRRPALDVMLQPSAVYGVAERMV